METIKVKTWGKDQGDYVLINASDFDESFHQLYEPVLEGAVEDQDKPKKRKTSE